jgi:hypothetical protein
MVKSIYSRQDLGSIAEYLMSFQQALTDEFMAGYNSLEEAIKENGTPNLAKRTYDTSNTVVAEDASGKFQSATESWSAVAFRCERHDNIMDVSFSLDDDHPHARKYPTAHKLIKQFGDNCSLANYSTMAPRSVVKRHTDPENRLGKNVRIHIPLIVPEGDVFLEVDGTEVWWTDLFGFTNQLLHSAFNLTDHYRLVFLLDLDREFVGLESGERFDPVYVAKAKPFIRNKNNYSIVSSAPPNGDLYIKRIGS